MFSRVTCICKKSYKNPLNIIQCFSSHTSPHDKCKLPGISVVGPKCEESRTSFCDPCLNQFNPCPKHRDKIESCPLPPKKEKPLCPKNWCKQDTCPDINRCTRGNPCALKAASWCQKPKKKKGSSWCSSTKKLCQKDFDPSASINKCIAKQDCTCD